jgi:hypothetical protein
MKHVECSSANTRVIVAEHWNVSGAMDISRDALSMQPDTPREWRSEELKSDSCETSSERALTEATAVAFTFVSFWLPRSRCIAEHNLSRAYSFMGTVNPERVMLHIPPNCLCITQAPSFIIFIFSFAVQFLRHAHDFGWVT